MMSPKSGLSGTTLGIKSKYYWTSIKHKKTITIPKTIAIAITITITKNKNKNRYPHLNPKIYLNHKIMNHHQMLTPR